MLASEVEEHSQSKEVKVWPSVSTEELIFYEGYNWCLNPHLTASEAHEHLGEEFEKLSALTIDWQRREVATNVYLLACGILNTVDEYLRGKTLRLPGPLGLLWAVCGLKSAAEWLGAAFRWRNVRQVRRWREAWMSAIGEFLPILAAAETSELDACAYAAQNLAKQLREPLPGSLRTERVGIPSPFQRLDLTHLDVLALGRRLMERLSDHQKPVLLIGLRTSGSYFALLIKAALTREGYATVALTTLEPNKGAGHWEMKALRRFSSQGFTGVIVDDPPSSGGTILAALEIAHQAGFHLNDLRVVAPTHSAKRDWLKTLPDDLVITLPPEHWHKQELLQANKVEAQLSDYFGGKDCSVSIVESERAKRFTAKLRNLSSDERATRLKRVYEVRLEAPGARTESLLVLAKSVGWGWLSYHAFIAAHRLAAFVPPLLGLRDGILYTQYMPPKGKSPGRHARIDIVAEYVAARARSLSLTDYPIAAMDLKRHNNGVRLLEKALSRAYGRFLNDTLMRSRVGARLRRQRCPVPTWIDGNMQQGEWITSAGGLLKTDYEHHGMGKAGLNVIDPAYDLADAILDLELSQEEESRLIQRYVAMSGDADIRQRLFLNKLLAGIWNMNQAQEQLFAPARDGAALETAHQRFIKAWNFLTVESARYSGRFCKPARQISWRAPLILLDVDGVIDQRLFGFPATTAAGVQALTKLSSYDCSVVLNTARSAAEVKDYCAAYFLAGGVAEYGSYIWDAVRGRGRVLIDAQSALQMESLRVALQQIPGVFLDGRHLYSIRAFTYCTKPDGVLPALLKSMKNAEVGDGAVAPLSPLLVKQVMTELGLDRLRVHHTMIDTTIVARDVDKGTGLVALRDWVLRPDSETIAVGDTEADLVMFRAATRSFAPGNIGCARIARRLGCEIVPHLYQQGLLEIACRITGSTQKMAATSCEALSDQDQIMTEIFSATDRSWIRNLLDALRHPSAFRIFLR
jgi:hydroxymethylpyrimidine pyrophosphatase-like HAD family hydrolase/adenine/guanine phosphoribosyltransferase-like PRPP-binding protein